MVFVCIRHGVAGTIDLIRSVFYTVFYTKRIGLKCQSCHEYSANRRENVSVPRCRQAYEQAKDRHQLIIIGISVLLAAICIALISVVSTTLKFSVCLFIGIFLALCGIVGMEILDKRITDFLHQHSTVCCDWTQQHTAKAFGEYFVKRAVKAGCDPQKAVDAMVPFLAAGDISYKAFDGYCRKKQEELERDPAKKQQEYERRRVKAAKHLQKKFLTPADGTAGQ